MRQEHGNDTGVEHGGEPTIAPLKPASNGSRAAGSGAAVNGTSNTRDVDPRKAQSVAAPISPGVQPGYSIIRPGSAAVANSTRGLLPPSSPPKDGQGKFLVPITGDVNLQQAKRVLSQEGKDSKPAQDQEPEIDSIGIKGYFRLVRIFAAFLLFVARVYLNTKGWLNFGKKKHTQTEFRQLEGALLRDKLLALGPTFIKIGQTLATRADILPVEYIQQLATLQDDVPPFACDEARVIVQSELGRPLEAVFHEVDQVPIAAASLGQVHRAKLISGELVVIKVQRPNLHQQIGFDISVLRRVARFLARFPDLIRGVDWQGSLGEFRATIFEEMDYVQEAQNAEVFRKNFAKWPEVYVPKIYHELSSRQVIVMEYIPGLKVTDVDELRATGMDPCKIVRLLSRTYLKQLLEDGFFHADPHPGNLRVMPDGRLAFFDFGMVGRLEMELQSKLINAFFHTMERDVPGLVEDLVRLGFIELTPDEEARFKPIIEGLIDRYLGMRLQTVQFRELIFDLAQVIYEFPFHIPASFTYIIRAMMTLEGIGTLVDPTFNFFEVARPYAKRFMFKREGRYLRTLIVESIKGKGGNIEWGKVWKLGKMLFKYYVRGEYKL
jgi:predicted unusual protein kinase regulating ubiquinone biosynthesis (AarF/ABC1/UbiB family)